MMHPILVVIVCNFVALVLGALGNTELAIVFSLHSIAYAIATKN